jgi:microcystin-dependent protein
MVAFYRNSGAPINWLPCDGRSLPVSQYAALYSLIGTSYGPGSGPSGSTFALPDLRGRVPLQPGTGAPSGVNVQYGVAGGSAATVLAANQLPQHTHPATFIPTGGGVSSSVQIQVANVQGTLAAGGAMLAKQPGSTLGDDALPFAPAGSPSAGVLAGVTGGGGGITGGTVSVGANQTAGAPLSLLQPYLGVNFIIAVNGLYPDFP